MRRKRALDTSFWTCEKVTPGLKLRQRLLFIGLISFQDDSGRLSGEPDLVKAQVFPFDKIRPQTIEKDLQVLEEAGLLYCYNIKGRRYIQLHGFHHQKLDHPIASRIPPHPNRELLARITRKSREGIASHSAPREENRREENGNSRGRWKKEKEAKPWD